VQYVKNWIKLFIAVQLISSFVTAEEIEESYTEWLRSANLELLTTLPDQPGYGDYLAVLGSNNPELKSLYHNWQASQKQISVVKAWSEPQIKTGIAVQPVITAQGPQDARIGVTQMLPGIGEVKSAVNTQKALADASHARLNSRLNDLNLELKYAYADFYLQGQELLIQKQTLALLSNWQQVLLTRYRSSTANHPDLIKTQLELLGLEDRIHLAQVEMENTRDKIRILLGLTTTPILPTPSQLEIDLSTTIQLDNNWLSGNPRLQIQESNQRAAHFKEQLTRTKTRPKLMLGIDWILTGDTDIVNPALKAGQDALVVNVGASIPLWRSKNRALKASARSNRLAQEAGTEAQIQKLKLSMEQVSRDWTDAKRRIELLEKTMIPKSQEVYAVMEKAYTAGNSDMLSLLDAIEKMLDQQLQLEKAKVRLWKTEARLNHLKGNVE
jgi:outer membrane protein TolC